MVQETGAKSHKILLKELVNNVENVGIITLILILKKISGLKKKINYLLKHTNNLETNGLSYHNIYLVELIIVSKTIGIQQLKEK